jgi:hypothetical protein
MSASSVRHVTISDALGGGPRHRLPLHWSPRIARLAALPILDAMIRSLWTGVLCPPTRRSNPLPPMAVLYFIQRESHAVGNPTDTRI